MSRNGARGTTELAVLDYSSLAGFFSANDCSKQQGCYLESKCQGTPRACSSLSNQEECSKYYYCKWVIPIFVKTLKAIDISSSKANLRGEFDCPNGCSVWFEYWKEGTTELKHTEKKTVSAGRSSFSKEIPIEANSKYYFKALAEKGEQKASGKILDFNNFTSTASTTNPTTTPTITQTPTPTPTAIWTPQCTPKSCLQLGKECDYWDDGCGNQVLCGNCAANLVCSNGKCVKPTTPTQTIASTQTITATPTAIQPTATQTIMQPATTIAPQQPLVGAQCTQTGCGPYKPYYCLNQKWVENCQECGCPEGYNCSIEENKCIPGQQKIITQIADFTAPIIAVGALLAFIIIALFLLNRLANHFKQQNLLSEQQRFEIAKRNRMLKDLQIDYYKRRITEEEFKKQTLAIQAEIKELKKNQQQKT
ncbi:MAG: hypothetical protein QXK06_01990 [Candidatus Diapherotrites archaeon]